MKNIFTEHPHSVNETYLQHFYFASKFGLSMIVGGLACVMHAIFPFAFKKTGSNFLLRMTNDFINRMPVVEERIFLIKCSIDSKLCESNREQIAKEKTHSHTEHVN